MKTHPLYLVGTVLSVLIFFNAAVPSHHSNSQHNFISTVECLPASEAQRILGEPVIKTEDSSKVIDHGKLWRCTYTASNKKDDPVVGHLYYQFERYHDVTFARQLYAGIVAANNRQPGQRTLNDLGDEAWFHSDDQNFCLLIFRKNTCLVRVKVNRLTNKTSIPDLIRAMKDVAAAI